MKEMEYNNDVEWILIGLGDSGASSAYRET
jgi:hypothetical protein